MEYLGAGTRLARAGLAPTHLALALLPRPSFKALKLRAVKRRFSGGSIPHWPALALLCTEVLLVKPLQFLAGGSWRPNRMLWAQNSGL
ncbi:hypothetical protein P7K49_030449, partial [Saguinus oedipus]